MTPGGLLDEAGLAVHWRPATRKSVQDAYGRWLTFLGRNGGLDPGASPAERLTPDRLRAFIAELQATVAPLTVRNRVRDLAEALRVMAPEADLSYLGRARARLKARARPVRNKRAQMMPSRDLVGLGLDLMRQAERGEAARPLWQAAMYRDGLMILMLASRPIRRASFAGLRLGQHLVKRGDTYVLLLTEDETKNHRRFEQPLPAALTSLDRALPRPLPADAAGWRDGGRPGHHDRGSPLDLLAGRAAGRDRGLRLHRRRRTRPPSAPPSRRTASATAPSPAWARPTPNWSGWPLPSCTTPTSGSQRGTTTRPATPTPWRSGRSTSGRSGARSRRTRRNGPGAVEHGRTVAIRS